MALRRLVLANAVDAIRAVGLELSEQELLRRLPREEILNTVQSRSTVPLAQKNCNLVDVKDQYPDMHHNDDLGDMGTKLLSDGDSVVGEIILTMNAGFLIVAKEIVALDPVRAATWLKLTEQECRLVEELSVEEILNTRSAFQRKLLLKRSTPLTHVLSAETELNRFVSIGTSLSRHAGIGEMEDVI